MHPEIKGIMARQHGLVTRRQLHALGIDHATVLRAVRRGDLELVRRAVYAEGGSRAAMTRWEERQLARDRAASAMVVPPHVMSHTSAALELGMPILRPPTAATHLTRRGVVGTHSRNGVHHHLAPYREDQVVEVNGRLVLNPARTAADIARYLGHPYGVVAANAALQMGATLDDLWTVADRMVSWPHINQLRAALDLADPGSETVGETLAAQLVIELGHGRPQHQFGLTDGQREAWCDLRLDRHIIEFDGGVKYRPPDRGGVALESADAVLIREKRRQDWISGFKLGMTRLTWSDVIGEGRPAALARLRREYDDTCRIFGTDIADLAPYTISKPRHRSA